MFHYKNPEMTDLFQWSKNVILVFSEEYFEEKIQFSNNGINSYSRLINENGEVAIPDELLVKSDPINIYVFHHDEDGAFTKERYTLKVIARSQPDDYAYSVLANQSEIYTEVEKLMPEEVENSNNKIRKLRIHLHGIDGATEPLHLVIFRRSTRRGRKSRWKKIEKWGYGQLAETYVPSQDAYFPPLPDWMGTGYVAEEIPITDKDVKNGYVDLNFGEWMMPLLRPDYCNFSFSDKLCLVGTSSVEGSHRIRFYIAKESGDIVGGAKNEVAFGCRNQGNTYRDSFLKVEFNSILSKYELITTFLYLSVT